MLAIGMELSWRVSPKRVVIILIGPLILFVMIKTWQLGNLHGGDPDRFTPPDEIARRAAIGETRYLPEIEKKTFAESAVFQAKTAPNEIDWLANHEEPGQTFDQFLRTRRNRLQKPRQILYVQPLGPFPATETDLLKKVADYAAIFFQTEVKTQRVIDPDVGKIQITRRQHPGPDDLQFLSTDVLSLLKIDLPDDAYARLAVTMTDLYPEESWNFVFGQASLSERVGVYSFARYGTPEIPNFLRRCVQVFTHETGHMFGLYHCIHYECLMNGSNSLAESDAGPLFLCPVCLRKLHAANAFDPVDRYQKMAAFFREAKLTDEQEWVTRRLAELR